MTQPSLFDAPRFLRSTYDPALDESRLLSQQARVNALMSDGIWRTLGQIHEATGYPESSISARLRDATRPEHGGFVKDRERVPGERGLWRYRLRKPGGMA